MQNLSTVGGAVLEISGGRGGGGVYTRYSVFVMGLRWGVFYTLLDI